MFKMLQGENFSGRVSWFSYSIEWDLHIVEGSELGPEHCIAENSNSLKG